MQYGRYSLFFRVQYVEAIKINMHLRLLRKSGQN